MTKERVEKGLKRMDDWYDNHPGQMNPLAFYGDDRNDILLKALMDISDEDAEHLDFETKRWFLEDEEEFQKEIDELERVLVVYEKFIDRVNYYWDQKYDNV